MNNTIARIVLFFLGTYAANSRQFLRGKRNTNNIDALDQSLSRTASVAKTSLFQNEDRHEVTSSSHASNIIVPPTSILSTYSPTTSGTATKNYPSTIMSFHLNTDLQSTTTESPTTSSHASSTISTSSPTTTVSSQSSTSTSFVGFHTYPICDVCREGSKLQFRSQTFELTNNDNNNIFGEHDEPQQQIMSCDVALQAGQSGILSPEYCLLSKRRCGCIREELNQWPELVGVTVTEAMDKIKEEFRGVQKDNLSFDILTEYNDGDNAVSSAITIEDQVQLHVKVNEDGEKIVSSIPTCYCGGR